MRTTKFLISATAAAAALLVVSGCTAQTAAPTKTKTEYTVAFVSGPLSDPFFPPVFQGAKDAGAAVGVKVNYIPIDEADIEATSAKTMQAAIAQKPDAIIVGNFIPKVTSPLIRQAVKAGIPVYEFNSGLETWKDDGAFGFVGSTPEGQGAIAGDTLVSEGAKNQVCVINVAGNPYLESICDAVKTAAEKGGARVDVLTLPSADSTDQGKISRDLGAYLQTHSGVDGIFTIGAVAGAAASSAVATAGGTDKIKVGVLGVSQDGVNQVKKGTLSFMLNGLPYLNGYDSVVTTQQYLKYGIAPGIAVDLGVQVVDSSNIAAVEKTYSAYPNVIGSK